MKELLGLTGFLGLALSPSFIDWQQSPDLRVQFVIYYIVTLALIYFGVFA